MLVIILQSTSEILPLKMILRMPSYSIAKIVKIYLK
jgi:hypothetical protein